MFPKLSMAPSISEFLNEYMLTKLNKYLLGKYSILAIACKLGLKASYQKPAGTHGSLQGFETSAADRSELDVRKDHDSAPVHG